MTHEMVRYLDELQMTQELEKTTETFLSYSLWPTENSPSKACGVFHT
jgi:hypothetical protein